MPDNPTRIESPESDSTLPYLEVGHTEGDAAGRVYLQDPVGRVMYLRPARGNDLRLALVAHLQIAAQDAATQKVTIPVTSSTTDAEIVSMVRAKLAE